MTIVNALKKLVTAWGGSTTADTIAEAIDDLSAVTPSSLPEVSSTDNGDILKVVSGEWAKGDPELPAVTATNNGQVLGVSEGTWAVVDAPSGGGVFLVNYTLTMDETTHEISVTNCDKTYAEIVSAAETQYPVAVLHLGPSVTQIPFDGISDNQISFKKSSISIVDAGGGSTQIGFSVTEVTHNSVAYMHYSESYAEITTT